MLLFCDFLAKNCYFFAFLKNNNKKGVPMLTFIAFVLMVAGGINWLLIGLLQYDFIAGLFGFQASMFSRLIYIIFGASSAFITIRTLLNKGSVKLFERRKKSRKANIDEEETEKQHLIAQQNSKQSFENEPSNQPSAENLQNLPKFGDFEDKNHHL